MPEGISLQPFKFGLENVGPYQIYKINKTNSLIVFNSLMIKNRKSRNKPDRNSLLKEQNNESKYSIMDRMKFLEFEEVWSTKAGHTASSFYLVHSWIFWPIKNLFKNVKQKHINNGNLLGKGQFSSMEQTFCRHYWDYWGLFIPRKILIA